MLFKNIKLKENKSWLGISRYLHFSFFLFFYNNLQNKSLFSKLSSFIKWEQDIGKEFSRYKWCQAYWSLYASSLCADHWELMHKVTHTVDGTSLPIKPATFHPTASPSAGTIASLLALLYIYCNSMHSYWNCIFSFLSEYTPFPILPTVEMALLQFLLLKEPLH